MCAAQIFLDSFLNRAGNEKRVEESFMSYHNVAPSRLPTFLLPCPFCGHRMAVTSVTPTMFAAEVAAEGENTELEDVTHGCIQCGTTLIRTILPMADAQEHRDI
jgi:hypothetical protein